MNSYNPQNGLPFGGNTEGGRLQRKGFPATINKSSTSYICTYPTSIQSTITPASGNRTNDLALGCARGITADRVQALLDKKITKNFSTETARILQLQQNILLENPDSPTPIPIVIQRCPPLAPPPAPPPRACILSKSQKY